MALTFNGVNIPASGTLTQNSVGLSTLTQNGVQVWKKVTDQMVYSYGSWAYGLANFNGGVNRYAEWGNVAGQGFWWDSFGNLTSYTFGCLYTTGPIDFTGQNRIELYFDSIGATYRGGEGNGEARIELYIVTAPNVDASGNVFNVVRSTARRVAYAPAYQGVTELVTNGTLTINTADLSGTYHIVAKVYSYYLNSQRGFIRSIYTRV